MNIGDVSLFCVVNSGHLAAVSMCVCVFVQIGACAFLGCTARGRISGLDGNSMFDSLRSCQTFPQGDCSILPRSSNTGRFQPSFSTCSPTLVLLSDHGFLVETKW